MNDFNPMDLEIVEEHLRRDIETICGLSSLTVWQCLLLMKKVRHDIKKDAKNFEKFDQYWLSK